MKKYILIVEDDPFLVEMYAAKLTAENFDIEVVNDGSNVLKKISEKKPDLILLDIVLPKVDGFEVLKKIKEDPKLKDIKVVTLTNLGQKDEVEKGLKLGADEYVIKAHYTPTEVVEKVKKLVSSI